MKALIAIPALLFAGVALAAGQEQPLTPPLIPTPAGCKVFINQYALGWNGDVLADTLTRYTTKCGRKRTNACEVQEFTDYGYLLSRQPVSCSVPVDADAVFSNDAYLTELYTAYVEDYGYRARIRTRTAFDALAFTDQGVIPLPQKVIFYITEVVTNVHDQPIEIFGTGAYSLSYALSAYEQGLTTGPEHYCGPTYDAVAQAWTPFFLQPGESCSYNIYGIATSQSAEERWIHTEVYTDGPTANGYSVEFIQGVFITGSP